MMRVYEPMFGESVEKTCQMLERMSSGGESAKAEFNGVLIVADVGAKAADLEAVWKSETARTLAAYEASPEGK